MEEHIKVGRVWCPSTTAEDPAVEKTPKNRNSSISSNMISCASGFDSSISMARKLDRFSSKEKEKYETRESVKRDSHMTAKDSD